MTFAERRKCVSEEHFCEQHARVSDPYVPRKCEHSQTPRTIEDTKQFDIELIVISEVNDQQVVYLREVGGHRLTPLAIGLFEAVSLDRRIKGSSPPRPLTHNAMAMIVREFG